MDIKDIYVELIHDKNQKKLSKFEKELNEKIKITESLEDKEELYFLLLVTKIEKSYLETVNIKHILLIYLSILDKIEESKKFKEKRFGIMNKKTNHVLVVFYNTMISRLHYLENLYSKNYSSDHNKSIRRRKYDYKKELHYHNNEK
ncbi:MAG: hypothetical protein U9Q66_00935 [Patescibacteria group bacterium]|nr:hypothetical protein [Patescibacteria group bacterium]